MLARVNKRESALDKRLDSDASTFRQNHHAPSPERRMDDASPAYGAIETPSTCNVALSQASPSSSPWLSSQSFSVADGVLLPVPMPAITLQSSLAQPTVTTAEEIDPDCGQIAECGLEHGGRQADTSGQQPAVVRPSMVDIKELDEDVAGRLGDFFGDQRMWQKVAQEVHVGGDLADPNAHTPDKLSQPDARERAAHSGIALHSIDVRTSELQAPACDFFRVKVPEPYPGIQYRKTKDINDRALKYAENRTLVKGAIEEDGEWLWTNGHGYLPMTMNGTQILERVGPDAVSHKSQDEIGRPWCLCCPAGKSSMTWPPDELPVNASLKNSSKRSTLDF